MEGGYAVGMREPFSGQMDAKRTTALQALDEALDHMQSSIEQMEHRLVAVLPPDEKTDLARPVQEPASAMAGESAAPRLEARRARKPSRPVSGQEQEEFAKALKFFAEAVNMSFAILQRRMDAIEDSLARLPSDFLAADLSALAGEDSKRDRMNKSRDG